MPNTTQISLPLKGMSTDIHRMNGDEKTYCFALNAITSDFFTGSEFMLGNEPSNVCAIEFPPNYQVVGFVEIPEQKRTIYLLTNPLNGNSQVGEVLNCDYKDVTDKVEKTFCAHCPESKGTELTPLEQRAVEYCHCQYYLIAQINCLNLNVNFPVDIEYKLTSCGVNLYFTDNLNERGFMYLDYLNGATSDHLTLSYKMRQELQDPYGCQCPEGYTYDPVDNDCKQHLVTPIIPSGTLRTACEASNGAYTNFGVALYNVGYNINGTGASTITHAFDTYWSNPVSNLTDGVLNRTALWACGPGGVPQSTTGSMLPLSENIGFIFPFDVPATKTYYVGIAGDNKVRIRVDCNTVMDMSDTAMATQYPAASTAAPFKYWHIYPITLNAGHHVIELTGYNFGSAAGFGAEIYDNTAAEILAATGGTGLNILFSTANMAGQQLHVSATFSGTCPGGSCMDIINGQLVCISDNVSPAVCTDCLETTYGDIDCAKLKVHPDFDKPCIEFIEFVNGGNLKEGVYQVLIAYSDVYGNPITNYFPASQTMPLFDKQIKFETNNVTNKALKFRINHLKANTFFENYNVVIAQTIDNFTEFIYAGTFNTTQNEYTYTGFEQAVQRLVSQEVFFRRPFYPLAKGVTKANNYLFYTGVSEYPDLNLQPIANNINLYWETVAVKEGAYADPRNTFYFHGYMRDEVYAFGIIFEFANGRETCAFHIPGREATGADLEEIDNTDVITDLDCYPETRNLAWQVYNTGSVIGGDYEYNDNCEVDKCWEYGNFAYWESTETYPHEQAVWGDLCGEPIRHHKFPDNCITHIHDSAGGTKIFKDNNYIFPIGVRVDHQSVKNALDNAVINEQLTQAERDSIVSYRIVRGNRVGHKSIDAKGMMYNMLQYTHSGMVHYFPNYPYNDLSADDFLNGVSNATQRFTFHSPDVHFVNSSLGNILKLETEEYGRSQGYYTYSDCQARHKFLSTFAHTLAFGLGMAAAISATGEKQCKVITYEGDLITSSHSESSGTIPYGNVHGTLTSGSGTISTGEATGDWDGTGDSTGTVHSHGLTGVQAADPVTGLPEPTNPSGPTTIGGFNDTLETVDSDGNTHAVTTPKTVQYTTCKGQDYQIFNSHPILSTLFAGVSNTIQRVMLGLAEMDKILETMRALIPYRNYSIQYNSVGKYNNYVCVADGNKVRKLDKTAYLTPHIQTVDEPSNLPDTLFETVKINNWDRESSVYLKIAGGLNNPTHTDNSKAAMRSIPFGIGDLNRVFERDIAAFYASIKRYVPNQYGQICNINYLETNSCSFVVDATYDTCVTKVFGGDTFINRFGLKRKMPFFQHTMCGLPDGSDVQYDELPNAGIPKYYFNTPQPLAERIDDESTFFGGIIAVMASLITDNQKNYDVSNSTVFNQRGYIHMFNYGVPYFLVESDINIDYRHGQNHKEKDFYPHNKDLKAWFEEENVPIHEDNYYFYNRTYSKQNHESPICTSCVMNINDLKCRAIGSNRIIYSETLDTENKNDNWLVFKANSFYDFPLTLGRLITADGIENDKVLVRLEKGTQIFSAYNTIQSSAETIQVGTGGMFKSRPRDIATTDLGYAGTSNKDILHTEYGHIWADAERGQVFNLATGGEGMDEISKDGMRNWFKENLPFQIRQDFPTMPLEDIDNNLNGIGLHYCFDKRFNRILITKLDYKAVDSGITYNVDTKKFYKVIDDVSTEVKLYNPKYFCNKSWTISYNFFQKAWVSFHSYTPNFYVEHIDTFESAYKRVGTLNQKTYMHNATNKSYQVFYGKIEPFIVEVQPKFDVNNNFVNSIEFNLDVIRYHNEFDTFYNRTKTFNKAIIYNESQTTGLRHLVVSNPENLTESAVYPKRVEDGYEILVTNSENIWRFNDFWDATRSQINNLPIFKYDCNNVNKKLNPQAINYDKPDFERQGIRNRMCRVRLINDAESNYKFVFNFGVINQRQSIR